MGTELIPGLSMHKVKFELIPTLTLAQNFRLAMTKRSLTFRDVAKRADVGLASVYNICERKSPAFVTKQVIRVGKTLGFTEKQIRGHVQVDRVKNKRTYSRRERLYQIMAELLELMDSRGAER